MARNITRATYHFKVAESSFFLVKNKGEELEGKLESKEGTFFYLNSDKYFKVKGHIGSTLKAYEDDESIVAEKLSILVQGLWRRLR